MATQAIESEKRPLSARVRANADEIRATVERHGGGNPRVSGSLARSAAHPESQIDITVDNVRLSLLRLVRLEDELTRLLGAPVNILLSDESAVRAQPQSGGDPAPL